MFQVLITQFCARNPSRFHITILDNVKFHRKKTLVIPPNLLRIFLPPYSPELNPVERFWLEVKRVLKNRVFATQEDLKPLFSAHWVVHP